MLAHVQGPGANFGSRGLCVIVGSGAHFRSRLATTRPEVQLTSCPLSSTVFLLLKVAGTGGHGLI